MSHPTRNPWQRLALSLLGVAVIAGIWRWAVWHLYSLPEAALASFTTITVNCLYAICAIVVFMVTGKLVYDWKNSSTSVAQQIGQHVSERVDERRHETIETIERDFRTPELEERYGDK